MFVDYYSVLEIAFEATQQEIKISYRTLAKKWHPDRNPQSDTTLKMQQIVEAYLILSDSEARRRYDLSYQRYMSEKQRFQQKNESKNQEKETNGDFRTSNVNGRNKSDQFFFDVEDLLLKKWMRNAKNQAKNNLTNMIKEFGESSSVGFTSLWGNLIIAVISFVVLKFIAVAIMQLFN